MIVPAADDASGARGARQSLFLADQGGVVMIGAAERKTASGSITAEVGKDLAGRVVIAHRARSGGPGMADGTWISPMSSRDLGMTLVSIFGPPRAHAQLGPGVDALDFVVDPARDPVGVA